MTEAIAYDAILLVSFGGPEQSQDVMPFLENVLRGRDVPRERMLEVAEHYDHFDGVSPINQQCRELIEALETALPIHEIDLPIYWGNRNWHPLLPDTLAEMQAQGVKRALAFVTSAYSSYSSCRQYLENISTACEPLGNQAPVIDKIRSFYNHPGFIEACTERLSAALAQITGASRDTVRIAFTAHSIPESMSASCNYVEQLTEASRLSAEATGIPEDRWELVFQSRSGPPHVPWLVPDIVDHLQALSENGCEDVIVMPIGFLSDHLEVLYDLDHEAQETCTQLGLNMVRAGTVGTHPAFVSAICQLIAERLQGAPPRALGTLGCSHDICPTDCCPAPPPRRPAGPDRGH